MKQTQLKVTILTPLSTKYFFTNTSLHEIFKVQNNDISILVKNKTLIFRKIKIERNETMKRRTSLKSQTTMPFQQETFTLRFLLSISLVATTPTNWCQERLGCNCSYREHELRWKCKHENGTKSVANVYLPSLDHSGNKQGFILHSVCQWTSSLECMFAGFVYDLFLKCHRKLGEQSG